MALAIFSLMHRFDILYPSNARILGCHFWVPFWGPILEVLGPRNVDLLINAAFIGQRFQGPKIDPFSSRVGPISGSKNGTRKAAANSGFCWFIFGENLTSTVFFGPQVSRITCLPVRCCRATRALAQQKVSPPTGEGLYSEIRFAAV